MWPKPTSIKQIDYALVEVNSFDMKYPNYESLHSFWFIARQRFVQLLKYKIPDRKIHKNHGQEVIISFVVKNENIKLTMDTDESYKLVVNWVSSRVDVTITAETYYGARHGLETLSQLIQYDDNRDVLVMPRHIEIEDGPVYKHRGILLDTARRYYTVESIKKTLGKFRGLLFWYKTI